MKIYHYVKMSFIVILFTLLFLNYKLFAQIPNNLDIIILVDVSGSMEFSLDGSNQNPGTPTSPGNPPNPNTDPNSSWQRMHYIRPGLNALATIFSRLFDPVSMDGGGVSTIRFAIGKFPGNSPDEFSWLEQNTSNNFNLRPYDAPESSNIFNGLTIRWAGTPIGTAIRKPDGAIQMFQTYPYSGSSTGSMVILFTDGKQYGGLDIYDPGFGSGSGEDHVAFRSDIDQKINSRPTKPKIVSLGFGDFSETDSETDFAMLKDISKEWDKYHPSDVSDIFTKDAINTAFSAIWGTTLTLFDPSFVINPGDSLEHSAYVTEYDNRLIFVVSWNEPKTDSTIQFTIKTSTGIIINHELANLQPDIDYDFGETFQMYTIQDSFLKNNIGEWKLRINSKQIRKPENYAYSILGYSNLQLRDVSDERNQPQFTGDSLELKISLSANKRRIPDAKLVAKITGPAYGAGNWFAGFPLTPQQRDSVKNINFKSHVEDVYKKYYYMRHLKGVSLPKSSTFEIPLKFKSTDSPSDGIRPVIPKLPGSYEAQMKFNIKDSLYYGKTPVLNRPGIYEVQIFATHASKENRLHFERELEKKYYLKLKPDLDWKCSSLTFEKIGEEYVPSKGLLVSFLRKLLPQLTTQTFFMDKFDIYKAKFTPKDIYLNFLKPGKEQNIKFIVKNAALSEKPVFDDLEGSYFKEIIVPEDKIQPILQMQYDDFVFKPRIITYNPQIENWRIKPTAFSIHFGMVTPTSNTSNYFKQNLYAAIDLNRQLSRKWVILVAGGLNRFNGKANIQDITYYSISTNLRWFPIFKKIFRMYIGSGAGFYIHDKGSIKTGYNVGVGMNISLSPCLDLEFGSDYNNIVMSGDDFKFNRFHVGFQIRF